GAALLYQLFLDGEVEHIAFLGDALGKQDIKFRLAKWRGHLVLDNLGAHAVSDVLVALLHAANAPHIDTHAGVELQRAATRRRFRTPEHHADLVANLVDEDHQGFRTADR